MSTVHALMKALRANPTELSPTMRLTIIAIADFVDLDRGAFPSLATIADISGFSRRAVVTAINDLVAAKWLTKTTKPGWMSTYAITFPDPVVSSMLEHFESGTEEQREAFLESIKTPVDPATPVQEVHQCSQCTSAGGTREGCRRCTGVVQEVHGGSAGGAPESLRESLRERLTEAEPVPAKPVGTSKAKTTRPAKPSKAVDITDPPGFAAVNKVYFEAFEAAKGIKPTFDSRDGAAVKTLLRKVNGDVAKASKIIRDAYADPYKSKSATIVKISADPSAYVATRTGPRATAPATEIRFSDHFGVGS